MEIEDKILVWFLILFLSISCIRYAFEVKQEKENCLEWKEFCGTENEWINCEDIPDFTDKQVEESSEQYNTQYKELYANMERACRSFFWLDETKTPEAIPPSEINHRRECVRI
jgi:hypothetical protein